MKLLTTIAAVLISISAFSQDYIEYENGIFTQNGEELSMLQIDDLTLLHKAGRGNVRRANRFDRMHKDNDLRFSNNGLNFIGGVATGFFGGIGVLIGGLVLDNGSGTGPALYSSSQEQVFVQSLLKHFQELFYQKKGVSEKEINNSIK